MSKPKRMPALSRIEIERDRSGFYVLTTVRRGLIETCGSNQGAPSTAPHARPDPGRGDPAQSEPGLQARPCDSNSVAKTVATTCRLGRPDRAIRTRST